MGDCNNQTAINGEVTILARFHRHLRSRRLTVVTLIITAIILVSCMAIASSNFSSTAIILRVFPNLLTQDQLDELRQRELEKVLREAAINETIIVTTLNAAWARKGAMAELFLATMQDAGENLLRQLIIGCMDQLAYDRCVALRSQPNFTINEHSTMAQGALKNANMSSKSTNFHCIRISTTDVDFSSEKLYHTDDYFKLLWRRIEFLGSILRLNYSFIFTDTDILWFRNPFPTLLLNDEEVDFQIASDSYNGIPSDLHNFPNVGFTYVKANNRTINFYNYWYEERKRDAQLDDQQVLNAIKFGEKFQNIGLKLHFLDTQYFAGFCAITDTDMTKVITMHATCCKGLNAKLSDLQMMLNDWKKWQQFQYMENGTLSNHTNINSSNMDPHFRMPYACPQSWH